MRIIFNYFGQKNGLHNILIFTCTWHLNVNNILKRSIQQCKMNILLRIIWPWLVYCHSFSNRAYCMSTWSYFSLCSHIIRYCTHKRTLFFFFCSSSFNVARWEKIRQHSQPSNSHRSSQLFQNDKSLICVISTKIFSS